MRNVFHCSDSQARYHFLFRFRRQSLHAIWRCLQVGCTPSVYKVVLVSSAVSVSRTVVSFVSACLCRKCFVNVGIFSWTVDWNIFVKEYKLHKVPLKLRKNSWVLDVLAPSWICSTTRFINSLLSRYESYAKVHF